MITQPSRFIVGVLVLVLISASVWGQISTPSEGIALQQQGKFVEAEKAWREVVGQNPNDAAAYASLGVVLSKQEKYAQAATAY